MADRLDGAPRVSHTAAMSPSLARLVSIALSLAAPSITHAATVADRHPLRAFEAALNGADSATAVLQRWCAARRLADPAVIRAERIEGADKPVDDDVRRRLAASPDEPIRYRHVRLTCGGHVLSEADNWYRPRLLTGPMNHALDETDTPFGAVVRPLAFHRQTIAVEWLLGRVPAAAGAVLRHRAVLLTRGGVPFSLVVETYTSEVLAGAAAP